MINMIMEVVKYEVNGVIYDLTESKTVHRQLQNDPYFAQEYFRENAAATEIIGCLENTAETDDFIWTNKSIKLLIHLYRERVLRFRDPKQKKKLLWSEILNKFGEHGYKGLTEDILDRKFRNMKKTFRTIKDNNKSSSTGRGRVNWEYFNDFLDIFQDDKTINFGKVISSMEVDTQPETQPLLSPVTVNTTGEDFISPGTSSIVTPSTEIDSRRNDFNLNVASNSSTKNRRGKKLNEFRKKQIEVEENRVKELTKLREAVERSNQIQAERNDLLKKIAEKNV